MSCREHPPCFYKDAQAILADVVDHYDIILTIDNNISELSKVTKNPSAEGFRTAARAFIVNSLPP